MRSIQKTTFCGFIALLNKVLDFGGKLADKNISHILLITVDVFIMSKRPSSSSSSSSSTVPKRRKAQYISLTTHPGGDITPLEWGNANPLERGPVVGQGDDRNVIGAHGGSYSIYSALSVATGALSADHKPDLTNTHPAFEIPPNVRLFFSFFTLSQLSFFSF